MQKADLTTRAVACFVDLLIVIGLARLPDVLGFLSASGYILFRDGLFRGRSVGKKLIGILVRPEDDEDQQRTVTYRESIVRNATFEAAYILFLIPYAGWVLGPVALVVEWLVAFGDDRAMRIGDMLARTRVVQPVPGPAPAGPDDLPPTTANEKQEPIAVRDQSEQNEQTP
jgi:uncharacterized RDD family membrane protein YckC